MGLPPVHAPLGRLLRRGRRLDGPRAPSISDSIGGNGEVRTGQNAYGRATSAAAPSVRGAAPTASRSGSLASRTKETRLALAGGLVQEAHRAIIVALHHVGIDQQQPHLFVLGAVIAVVQDDGEPRDHALHFLGGTVDDPAVGVQRASHVAVLELLARLLQRAAAGASNSSAAGLSPPS